MSVHVFVAPSHTSWEPQTIYIVRQRPTLPPDPSGSTISVVRLNDRVRNGTGCFPYAITTETSTGHTTLNMPHTQPTGVFHTTVSGGGREPHSGYEQSQQTMKEKMFCATTCCCVTSPRLISTGQLHTLQCFHIQPINPVVYRKSYQIHLREPSSRSVLPA